jgi:hypothetical protein
MVNKVDKVLDWVNQLFRDHEYPPPEIVPEDVEVLEKILKEESFIGENI